MHLRLSTLFGTYLDPDGDHSWRGILSNAEDEDSDDPEGSCPKPNGTQRQIILEQHALRQLPLMLLEGSSCSHENDTCKQKLEDTLTNGVLLEVMYLSRYLTNYIITRQIMLHEGLHWRYIRNSSRHALQRGGQSYGSGSRLPY